jgi:uncharacterized protein YqgV (UPF0045/DUF77 family)
MGVSAQVSVYPLGQGDLTPAIQAAWKAFCARGLNYQPGPMSTLLEGDTEKVFAALRDAFQAATAQGATVMVVTVSNACPPLPSQEAVAGHE